MRRSRSLLFAAALVPAAACPALATWSIVLIDTRTREVALGSATCLTGFDLRAGTPVLIPLLGGATAQSSVDSSGANRVFIRDHLLRGTPPPEILDLLADFDSQHQNRQYGIADITGGRATFSGTRDGAWAGGRAGEFEMTIAGRTGTVVYAIQGNVLTGEPVVLEAVKAAIETPGDLPAKLMFAMEAARAMGGDGRCSCKSSDPDGCGSPPEQFIKSAHIAYMLIARAGDLYAGNGIYKCGRATSACLTLDVNGDGLPEVLTANSTSDDVSLLINTTAPGDPFITFNQAASLPAGDGCRAIATADFNSDGIADLATADGNAGTVSLLFGAADGSFGAATPFFARMGPAALAVADFNADTKPDLAVSNAADGSVQVFLGDGAGNLAEASTVAGLGEPRSLAAGDLDGDGLPDLVVALRSLDTLALLHNSGNGVLTYDRAIEVGQRPADVLALDLDNDHDTDIVCLNGGDRTFTVLGRAGDGYTAVTSPLDFAPNSAEARDLDGDGLPDLIFAGASDFAVFKNSGDGSFAPDAAYKLGTGGTDLALGDFNGDRNPDLAIASQGSSTTQIVENYGPGASGLPVFNDGEGCATGDYFMNFNIAFAKAADPDPVYTLRARFDEWRTGHTGRPDAIASRAAFSPARLVADGKSQTTLTIALSDWQDAAITTPISSLTVTHAADSAGSSTIGSVTDLGAGRYSVTLTAGTVRGTDRFLITADDGVRPVTLMPEPTLALTVSPDFNADGRVNIHDWTAFYIAFTAHDMRADLNGDGVLDTRDFETLRQAFTG